MGSRDQPGLPQPKVSLLPTFYFPDEAGTLQAVTNSTPIIRRLEREHSARSVRPANPALALIDAILEDYGDEWLTKAMFHYRWHYADDIARSAAVLPNWARGRMSDEALKTAGTIFAERQIPRLRYVGSNETTWDVIEASYMRFLDAIEAHLRDHAFLLGARPGAGDFGIFGQLTQLALFDPTPMAITAVRAPRVMAWTGAMEDLTGLEPQDADWFDPAALPGTLTAAPRRGRSGLCPAAAGQCEGRAGGRRTGRDGHRRQGLGAAAVPLPGQVPDVAARGVRRARRRRSRAGRRGPGRNGLRGAVRLEDRPAGQLHQLFKRLGADIGRAGLVQPRRPDGDGGAARHDGQDAAADAALARQAHVEGELA